jgi:hypothetical protein
MAQHPTVEMNIHVRALPVAAAATRPQNASVSRVQYDTSIVFERGARQHQGAQRSVGDGVAAVSQSQLLQASALRDGAQRALRQTAL